MSGIVLALLSRISLPAQADPQEHSIGFWRRVSAGFDHARERPPALLGLALLAITSLTAAAFLSILPMSAQHVFDRPVNGFTVLADVSGLGSVIGAFTTSLWTSAPTFGVVSILFGCFGLSVAIFGSLTSWTAGLVAMVLVGGMYFAATTSLNAVLQYLASEEMGARLLSLFIIAWGGLVPVGALWQGWLADSKGPQMTMIVTCLMTAVAASIIYVWNRSRST